MRLHGLIPLLTLLAGPAVAQVHFADPDGAAIARGPAETAIRAELTKRNVPCYDVEKGDVTCRIVDRALNADVHYGTVAGTARQAALVSIRWQSDTTGNAVDARAYVFLDDGAGTFSLVHAGPMVGQPISTVSFEPGLVRYKTKSLRRNDSRAAPTGTREVTMSYAVKGDAPSAGTTSDTKQPPAATTSPERTDQALAFARKVMLIKNDMRFDANLRAVMTPSLRATYENAMSPPQECPVYDGDPRAGGVQGLNGIHAVKSGINVGASAPQVMAVDMSFRDREMPGTLFRSQFRIELTSSGWFVDDFIDREGKSFRATLRERVRECGSPRARKSIDNSVDLKR